MEIEGERQGVYPLKYLNLFSREVSLRLVDFFFFLNSEYQIGFVAFYFAMNNLYLLQCFIKRHFKK